MPWFNDILGGYLQMCNDRLYDNLLEYLRQARVAEPEKYTLPMYMTDEEFLAEYRINHYPKSLRDFMDSLIEKATDTKIVTDRRGMMHLIFPRQCGRTSLYNYCNKFSDYLNGSSTIES